MDGVQKLGELMAQTLQGLEEDFPDGSVGDAMIVIEVQSERGTLIRTMCSDDRLHVQLGLLHTAMASAKS